jgi:hypothetical protein
MEWRTAPERKPGLRPWIKNIHPERGEVSGVPCHKHQGMAKCRNPDEAIHKKDGCAGFREPSFMLMKTVLVPAASRLQFAHRKLHAH